MHKPQSKKYENNGKGKFKTNKQNHLKRPHCSQICCLNDATGEISDKKGQKVKHTQEVRLKKTKQEKQTVYVCFEKCGFVNQSSILM